MNLRLTVPTMLCLIASGIVIAGCEGLGGNAALTPDQRKQIADSVVLNNQGMAMAQQGDAIIAQGRTLKDHGDMAGGDKMIADGEAIVKQGRGIQGQAKRMKALAQLPPGTVLPPAPATVPATQKAKKQPFTL